MIVSQEATARGAIMARYSNYVPGKACIGTSQDVDASQSSLKSEESGSDESPTSLQNFKKRSRKIFTQDGSDGDPEDIENEATGITLAQKSKKRRPAQRIKAVKIPALVLPRSSYRDYEHSAQVLEERDVLAEALVSACFPTQRGVLGRFMKYFLGIPSNL